MKIVEQLYAFLEDNRKSLFGSTTYPPTVLPTSLEEAFTLAFTNIELETREHYGTTYTVPVKWSHTATRIFCEKYCQKQDVPDTLSPRKQRHDVPEYLRPHGPAERGTPTGGETDVRRVVFRLARWWTYTGLVNDYFGEKDAWAFMLVMCRLLILQVAAPNSPQWFNVGLGHTYGRKSAGTLFRVGDTADFAVDGEFAETEEVLSSDYPNVFACFLLGMDDNLCQPGGIMDGFATESRLFKYGAGCGVNVSSLRAAGSHITGGGKSSGVVSFLDVGNAVAGSIKSGGAVRRAALMRVLDFDHGDADDFIDWKVREEHKVSMLRAGSRLMVDLVNRLKEDAEVPGLAAAAMEAGISEAEYDRLKRLVAQGGDPSIEEITLDWQGDGYLTVSGQNSNNTVRIASDVMQALERGEADAEVENRFKRLCEAAWLTADPGVHFSSTINSWNTCASTGEIRTSNPCSEVMHLDNTACHLASINLVRVMELELPLSQVAALLTLMLDIALEGSALPSPAIARGTHNCRNVGLGFSNLGGLLMRLGVPYASASGRDVAAQIQSTIMAAAWRTSADMAASHGYFPIYQENEEDCLRVLRLHFHAEESRERGCSTAINEVFLPRTDYMWTDAANEAEVYGLRNAQLTAIAPTGTIGLIMDCDTLGIEPDFSLVKYKELSGKQGTITIVNQAVEYYLEQVYGNDPAYVGELKDRILKGDVPGEFKGIFACANDIPPFAHLHMCAAVQPFVSGSISKTINLPNSATIEDVRGVYLEAWKLGLKCVSVYRDGCKLSQPLNRTPCAAEEEPEPRPLDAFLAQPTSIPMDAVEELAEGMVREMDQSTLKRGERRRLKGRHPGVVQKVRVGGQGFYMITGEYSDGSLGELFIEISRRGSTLRGLFGVFSQVFSLALQYGAPLEDLLDSLDGTGFEPNGPVEGDANIMTAASIVDFIARNLRLHYLQDPSRVHVQVFEEEEDEDAEAPELHQAEVRLPYSWPHEEGDSFAGDTSAMLNTIDDALHVSPEVDTSPRGGYTGDQCSSCGSFRLRRAGVCSVCEDCGETTGCG